jgi:hypothetical protein
MACAPPWPIIWRGGSDGHHRRDRRARTATLRRASNSAGANAMIVAVMIVAVMLASAALQATAGEKQHEAQG